MRYIRTCRIQILYIETKQLNIVYVYEVKKNMTSLKYFTNDVSVSELKVHETL